MSKPRIAITLGDPAGIGPEIVFRAVNSLKVKRVCSPVIFGDRQNLNKYFKSRKNCELIESSFVKKKIYMGRPSALSGKAALSAIEKAVESCVKGYAEALVNAPVSKESFKLAGSNYPGHTELLADLTNSKEVAMMMVCGKICGAMVTRHIPLSAISSNIKTKDIVGTVMIAHAFFNKRGKKNIRTVLCALNPHASDNGILGIEEKKFIFPAYEILKKAGIDISKPQPADSAWLKTKNGEYDLICTMYHDQLMIPLKCIDAKKIVNVTAGLPFVRTSPGHGTAFDIAGKGKASPDSIIEAILYAAGK
ncbi:MAG: 4-hydroxythreonine-4-phosphate dehydrogenase PdxA [Endomicrobium sp.]|jgi:4-hydroxythreonine-4-phosphate dehydrogenase|nr:4-hydroxythreonine-4-phosphate dehydrogenase PdxA [Endomicrobium sp.]